MKKQKNVNGKKKGNKKLVIILAVVVIIIIAAANGGFKDGVRDGLDNTMGSSNPASKPSQASSEVSEETPAPEYVEYGRDFMFQYVQLVQEQYFKDEFLTVTETDETGTYLAEYRPEGERTGRDTDIVFTELENHYSAVSVNDDGDDVKFGDVAGRFFPTREKE